jgi:hypothetical protein
MKEGRISRRPSPRELPNTDCELESVPCARPGSRNGLRSQRGEQLDRARDATVDRRTQGRELRVIPNPWRRKAQTVRCENGLHYKPTGGVGSPTTSAQHCPKPATSSGPGNQRLHQSARTSNQLSRLLRHVWSQSQLLCFPSHFNVGSLILLAQLHTLVRASLSLIVEKCSI